MTRGVLGIKFVTHAADQSNGPSPLAGLMRGRRLIRAKNGQMYSGHLRQLKKSAQLERCRFVA